MTTSVYETKHVDKIVKLGLFGGGNIAILNADSFLGVLFEKKMGTEHF